MRRQSTLRVNLAVALFSSCVALGVFEAAIRLLVPTTDIPWYRPDEVVGYGLEPNQQGRWISPVAQGSYHINRQGFNNEHEYTEAREPGLYRVAVLGDSFVEAFQVQRGQRFFDLLETKLKAEGLDTEVYTFGASGYGTGQEMLLLDSEVLRYRPDLVLVVFVENDLNDTACVLPQSGDEPCFKLDEQGQLGVVPVPPHKRNLAARVLLRSAAARYILMQRRVLDRLRSLGGGTRRSSIGDIYLKEPPTEWREAWRVVDACLARMAGRCREANTPFLITNHVQMDLLRPSEGTNGEVDLDEPARILGGIVRSRDIDFVDLTGAFRRAAAIDAEPLTIPGDGHWSVRGHRLVAEALAGPIRDALLRRKSPAAPVAPMEAPGSRRR
jgi:lysophospholipase L1-like esterase